MTRLHRVILAAIAVTVFGAVPSNAQDEEDRPAIPWSQKGGAYQRIGYTEIQITYNRPVARGRDLFGSLVKWGRIWNPGADSATTIVFSDRVWVNDHELPAGSYSLWLIPTESAPWTVIFSRRIEIYHTPYPGEEHDALRFQVEPETGAHMEVLAFYFPELLQDRGVLRMHWGETVIPLSIRVDVEY